MPLRVSLAILVVLLAAGVIACGGGTNKAGGTSPKATRPTVLELASADATRRDLGEFLDAVTLLSRGRLQIHVTPDVHKDDVDYDQRLIGDVRAGRHQMAKVGVRAFDLEGVTSFRPLAAPLVVDSYELEKRVLESPLANRMLGGVQRLGLVGVGLLPGDLRRPFGLRHPLVRPADFAGLRFGTRPSALGADTVRALGAEPVAWVKSGHLRGLDALDLDSVATAGNEYVWHRAAITTNLALWPRAQAIVINRHAYDGLSAHDREVLRLAAATAIDPGVERLTGEDTDALSYLCAQGVRLVRAGAADRAAMRRALAPVIAGLRRDGENRSALEQIAALADGVEQAAPETPRCSGPPPAHPPAPADRALVGSWQANVTRHRYFAAHPLPLEEDKLNWGPQTLQLKPDGRFSYINQRFPTKLAGFGVYDVNGQELDFHAAGSSEQGGGETWRMRWNLYRGVLTLRRVGSGRSPTALIATAWHSAR
jgi:TRAP-type C4-dicarboxylate transport system substrate-binding protein